MAGLLSFVNENAGWILKNYGEEDIARIQAYILNLQESISNCEDKLRRRNMQIKELKERSVEMFNECVSYNYFIAKKHLKDEFASFKLNR